MRWRGFSSMPGPPGIAAGHTRTQALGERDHVGHDPEVLVAEPLAGAAAA